MKNLSDLRSVYDSFWAKFLPICDRGRLSIFPRQFHYKLGLIGNGASIRMKLKNPIHLKEWPYKRGSRKTIHIIVRAFEVFSSKNFELKSSNVHIAYFEINKTRANMIERIRYDFKTPSDKGDPLFHAHISSKLERCIDVESFKFRVFNGVRGRLNHIHIPTANMNLISVLISLVADHANNRELTNLIKQVQKMKLQLVDCQNILNNMEKYGRSFMSLHWYEC